MSIKITEQIIKLGANRPGGIYSKTFITIHETGNSSNGAASKNHAIWLSNGGNGEVGYHYTVDDKEIYHHIPNNERAWHAGDGGDGQGNNNSIGIELCVNSDGNFEQTKKNAAWLVGKLMVENNIRIENVVQHNHWSGKNCPEIIRKTGKWNEFVAMCVACATEYKKTIAGNNNTGGEIPPQKGIKYRVQVGSFSNRANAESMSAELKSKGYANIIVN